eukprot:UN32680
MKWHISQWFDFTYNDSKYYKTKATPREVTDLMSPSSRALTLRDLTSRSIEMKRSEFQKKYHEGHEDKKLKYFYENDKKARDRDREKSINKFKSIRNSKTTRALSRAVSNPGKSKVFHKNGRLSCPADTIT